VPCSIRNSLRPEVRFNLGCYGPCVLDKKARLGLGVWAGLSRRRITGSQGQNGSHAPTRRRTAGRLKGPRARCRESRAVAPQCTGDGVLLRESPVNALTGVMAKLTVVRDDAIRDPGHCRAGRESLRCSSQSSQKKGPARAPVRRASAGCESWVGRRRNVLRSFPLLTSADSGVGRHSAMPN
jgi:hypothetical protein